MSCASPPPPAGALAPGFRFYPTDEELVSYYLKRKVAGRPFRVDAISEVDLYGWDPWELPGKSRIRSRDSEWYFFCTLDNKYASRSLTNRGTGSGYWKATGKDRPVCSRGGRAVGMKKTLVFHIGRAPKGERTGWVMHEYRLVDEELPRSRIPPDAFVVCRIFQKRARRAPRNGAELTEEVWEDDEAPILEVEDGDGTSIDAGSPVHKETGDCENQDVVVQDKNTALLRETDGHVDFCKFVVSDSLPKSCQDEGIDIDVEENNNLPELHNDQNLDGMGQYNDAADPNCSLTVHNGYVELNDLTYQIANNGQEDVTCHGAIRNDANLVNHGISYPQDLYDMEYLFDTNNEDNDLSKPFPPLEASENYYYEELDVLLGPEPGEFCSGEPGDDGILYFDAPSYYPNADRGLSLEYSNFTDLTMQSSNGTNLVDELISYFDAKENMQSDLDCESGASTSNQSKPASAVNEDNPQACQASPQQSVTESSFLAQDSGKHLGVKAIDAHLEPDTESDNSCHKTLPKTLVSMLGAISAPPALAAEHPTKGAQIIGHCLATHSSSSIRITAGMIWMDGTAMSSNGKNFSEEKNGHVGFILPYGMTRNGVIGNLASLELMPKMPGGIAAFVVQNSFHLLFLCVLFLATAIRIGVYIYTR